MPAGERSRVRSARDIFGSTADQKIVIVGAGIAGLTAAARLQQLERKVEVHDSLPALPTAGNYVNLHEDNVKRLEKLGINRNDIIGNTSAIALEKRLIPASRRRVVAALSALLDPDFVTVTWGSELAGVDSERAALTFDDGSQVEFDLLIGADGRHGAARALVDPTRQPQHAGYVTASGFAPLARCLPLPEPPRSENQGNGLLSYYAELVESETMEWHIMASVPKAAIEGVVGTDTPGSHRKAGAYPRSTETWFREVLAPHIGPNMKHIVDATTAFDITSMAEMVNPTHVLHELRGKPVALIGEALALHQPVTGSGAGSAIYQGWNIAEAIGPPSRSRRSQWRKLDAVEHTILFIANDGADRGRRWIHDFGLDGNAWPEGTDPPEPPAPHLTH
jgi:2-polyprenyl-6-methoxyphenol hydroxylase-like FAD-dependent oxidoreductase